MSSIIDVDAEATKVDKITIETSTIAEYLSELADMKIKTEQIMDNKIQERAKIVQSIDDDIVILTDENDQVMVDFEAVMKNRRTIIKPPIKKDIPLNNKMAVAFPNDFNYIEPKAPEAIQTDDGLACMRLVQVLNETTNQYEKYDCVLVFETQEELDTHRQAHADNGELV